MNKSKQIYNPSKLSPAEKIFINMEDKSKKVHNVKKTFKGRMISMSDEFYEELNAYLKNNPTEGNRSSFIVRIVAEYIKNKQ